jgi:hypothetical protein
VYCGSWGCQRLGAAPSIAGAGTEWAKWGFVRGINTKTLQLGGGQVTRGHEREMALLYHCWGAARRNVQRNYLTNKLASCLTCVLQQRVTLDHQWVSPKEPSGRAASRPRAAVTRGPFHTHTHSQLAALRTQTAVTCHKAPLWLSSIRLVNLYFLGLQLKSKSRSVCFSPLFLVRPVPSICPIPSLLFHLPINVSKPKERDKTSETGVAGDIRSNRCSRAEQSSYGGSQELFKEQGKSFCVPRKSPFELVSWLGSQAVPTRPLTQVAWRECKAFGSEKSKGIRNGVNRYVVDTDCGGGGGEHFFTAVLLKWIRDLILILILGGLHEINAVEHGIWLPTQRLL